MAVVTIISVMYKFSFAGAQIPGKTLVEGGVVYLGDVDDRFVLDSYSTILTDNLLGIMEPLRKEGSSIEVSGSDFIIRPSINSGLLTKVLAGSSIIDLCYPAFYLSNNFYKSSPSEVLSNIAISPTPTPGSIRITNHPMEQVVELSQNRNGSLQLFSGPGSSSLSTWTNYTIVESQLCFSYISWVVQDGAEMQNPVDTSCAETFFNITAFNSSADRWLAEGSIQIQLAKLASTPGTPDFNNKSTIPDTSGKDIASLRPNTDIWEDFFSGYMLQVVIQSVLAVGDFYYANSQQNLSNFEPYTVDTPYPSTLCRSRADMDTTK
jgi:hypothetical protein